MKYLRDLSGQLLRQLVDHAGHDGRGDIVISGKAWKEIVVTIDRLEDLLQALQEADDKAAAEEPVRGFTKEQEAAEAELRG